MNKALIFSLVAVAFSLGVVFLSVVIASRAKKKGES